MKIEIPIAEKSQNERAQLVKRMVIGTLIAEYAMRELDTHFELKRRTRVAISACEKVQHYLLYNYQSSVEQREVMKKEFLKENAVLMAELADLCWNLEADDLEMLIKQIKENTIQDE